jgi:DNA end-binding protein Ku
MARDIWKGTLSFGLVVVPVRLVNATRDRGVHFHQVDMRSGERVAVHRIAETDQSEVRWDEIGHGYDLDGQLVTLTDDELATVAPKHTRTIEIEEFVELSDVDPAQFDQHYFLLPDSDSEGALRAYRLLRDAMAAGELIAVGRVVLRTNERLVAVHVREDLLGLTTLLYANELRNPDAIGTLPDGDTEKPKRAEMTQALKLIDALTEKFDPASYEDLHRKRLLDTVKSKQGADGGGRGSKQPAKPAAKEPAASTDLMAALKESLARQRA